MNIASVPVHPEYVLSEGGANLSGQQKVNFPTGKYSQTENGTVRHLLMLGGSLLQLPAIRMAREEGWKIILADGNPAALARPWVDYFEHIDLKAKDELLVMARRYHQQGLLHGVFTAATDFSASVAWVSEALGLPGIPYEVALNASSKLRMRRIFREKAIPSPDFVEIAPTAPPNLAEITRLKLPVVVKPIDNMGARGVKRLDDWADLPAALADACGFSRQGTVIVEEFIQGAEYSIDSLVIDGQLIPCGLAVRHVCFPPHFVEVGHTLPSDLQPEQVAQLVKVFSQAVAALGITNGAAKGDVFFSPAGPMIGEIAARLSGGYMSGWTFPLASGLELTRAALYLAMGIAVPDLSPTLDRVSAERAIIALPGQIAAIEGLESCRRGSNIAAVFMRTRIGDRTVFPKNNVEKAGNVIAVHDSRTIACQSAEVAVSQVFLRMRHNDPATDQFLFETNENQPVAYPDLLKELDTFDYGDGDGRPALGLANGILTVADLRQSLSSACLQEKDWAWRSLADCLFRLESGQIVAFCSRKPEAIDRLFWLAMARGGLSGAAYVADTVKILTDAQLNSWIRQVEAMYQT